MAVPTGEGEHAMSRSSLAGAVTTLLLTFAAPAHRSAWADGAFRVTHDPAGMLLAADREEPEAVHVPQRAPMARLEIVHGGKEGVV